MIWLGNQFDFDAGSILNFHKPEGKSSFWIVKQVRKIVQAKVGHAGTLDPFARGVLILCTGKATKTISQFVNLPKIYIGDIELGKTTNTDDVTGAVISEAEIPPLDIQMARNICNAFVGDIWQIPPMFSAKKINGKPMYKIALAGEVVPRRPSLVHVENIEVLSFDDEIIKIKVSCSKGTYIRALARDIGIKIGCGAFLKSLTRTQIGSFKIEESLDLDRFEEIVTKNQPLG